LTLPDDEGFRRFRRSLICNFYGCLSDDPNKEHGGTCHSNECNARSALNSRTHCPGDYDAISFGMDPISVATADCRPAVPTVCVWDRPMRSPVGLSCVVLITDVGGVVIRLAQHWDSFGERWDQVVNPLIWQVRGMHDEATDRPFDRGAGFVQATHRVLDRNVGS
jgi:hypothetical protein